MGSEHDSAANTLRRIPVDLALAVGLAIVAIVSVIVFELHETPYHTVVTLPLVVFVPGYTLVAAVFPAASHSLSPSEREGRDTGPDPTITAAQSGAVSPVTRATLSILASLAVVAPVVIGLNATPRGVRLGPLVLVVSVFTIFTALIGVRRRLALEPADRLRVPTDRWIATARTRLFTTDSRADRMLTLLLIVCVLVALGSVGYALTAPKEAGTFTEFYLLSENETGSLVADDYPTEFIAGEPRTLVVGIGNQEYETVSYTVVVQIQRVRIENNDTTVLRAETLQQFSPTVPHNETWQRRHQVTPTITGDRLRLTYLLYRGEPPSTATAETAYRELHLWIRVSAPQS